MHTAILYTLCTLIWGTTWSVIKFQVGRVPPGQSVAYRFIIASIILLLYCRWRKVNMTFNLKQHGFIALQGAFMFCIVYLLEYYASQYLTSGLVAVVFSTIVGMNIINSRIFLKHKLSLQLIAGAILGFSGVFIIFFKEFANIENSSLMLRGIIYTLIATYAASLGNILSAHNQKNKLPVLQTNAYAMFYAAILNSIIALINDGPLQFDASPEYIISMLYLVLFGSIIAFGAYLTVLGRIGPSRASYTAVLIPIIAVFISVVAESYQLTSWALVGIVIVMAGNVLVLSGKS